ncbi:MAG: tetratricopeptide repeat protein [Candidatus Riflebacteria bacterium]|nr:tetratricopeptide repeat protein [Candidatus Riflebacteria bacterium]
MKKRFIFLAGCILFSQFSDLNFTYAAKPGTGPDTFLTKARDEAKNNLQDAINTLSEGLTKFPNDPKILYAMGTLLEKINRLDESLDTFKKVKNILPNYPSLSFKIELLEVKIALEKRNKSAYLNADQKKARELFLEVLKDKSLGKFEIAFPKFIECADLDPDFLDGIDQGIIKTGLNYYSVAMSNNQPDSLFYHSVYLALMGDFSKALIGLNKYVSSDISEEKKALTRARIKKIEEWKKNLENSLKLTLVDGKTTIEKPQIKTFQNIKKAGNENSDIVKNSSETKIEIPTNVNELISKGLEAKETGNLGLATKYLFKANNIAKSPETLFAIAEIYYSRAKQISGLSNAATDAIHYLREVIKQFPGSNEAIRAQKYISSFRSSIIQKQK